MPEEMDEFAKSLDDLNVDDLGLDDEFEENEFEDDPVNNFSGHYTRDMECSINVQGNSGRCTIKILYGDPAAVLAENSHEVEEGTCDRYNSFIPITVNKLKAADLPNFLTYTGQHDWVTGACLAYLGLHPGTTQFDLEGVLR